jgi:uncharacterized SAM-binding protein YcdF (DUF218 family)
VTRAIARVVVATALGAILVGAWVTFRVWDVGNHDQAQRADAIVVLGAAQYDGRPSAILKARLDHGIELYSGGIAKYLVVTGGKAAGDRTTEAATARTYALGRGVPAEAILVEDVGRTTLESLRGVAAVLRDHRLTTAVFVSDRTHMLRVLRIARDVGIVGYGSPTATSPADQTVGNRAEAIVHELGGLALYFVTGQSP